jgi:hypothetical protein
MREFVSFGHTFCAGMYANVSECSTAYLIGTEFLGDDRGHELLTRRHVRVKKNFEVPTSGTNV